MAKIKWEISRAGYGVQYEVVASTRADAIAIAQAKYLEFTSYEEELIGSTGPDGDMAPFTRSHIPEYTAAKLGRA